MRVLRRKKLKGKTQRPPRKGFYILPNLMTTASLFCGFYALMSAVNEDFERAAMAVLASFFFDGLDGRIARATRTTSSFGVQYDSLADLVAFGVAPAVLVFLWAVEGAGRVGWLAAFLFVACGALRLARFNVMAQKGSLGHFKGLPIPAAAAVLATMVLFTDELGLGSEVLKPLVLISLYSLSFLMVSSIPYHSFKDLELVKQKPFQTLVLCVLILVVVLAAPPVTLFLLSVGYAISGPVRLARGLVSGKRGATGYEREAIAREDVL